MNETMLAVRRTLGFHDDDEVPEVDAVIQHARDLGYGSVDGIVYFVRQRLQLPGKQ